MNAFVLLSTWHSAHAASLSSRMEKIDSDLTRVEERLNTISTDYSSRRGLIGAVDARVRYEDSVYAFLVGNYETAANEFFVLVESEALANPALHRDSEWYLAESLFELGNYETAATAYNDISEVGPSHPFFAESVRRQLEIYGLLDDSDRFYEFYNAYIVSGKVPATDIVKYTVAKSFYRQGDSQKAHELLDEIAADSLYHSRSLYLKGVIHTADGELKEATEAFAQVAQMEPRNSMDREVREYSNLAAARIHYEMGEYSQAVDYYIEVTNESEHFADELYELVWTFVMQEYWLDAVRAIDTFLIAFPEHHFALQLQLLRGHLHMKQVAYDDALGAYSEVIENYTPVRDQLAQIDLGAEDPVAFFQRVVDENTLEVAGEALPAYATDMLFSDQYVGRAKSLHGDLSSLSEDLSYARLTIDEVSSVLMSGVDSVGTFVWGQREVQGLRDQIVDVASATMQTEIDYIMGEVPDKMKPELRSLKADVQGVRDRADELKSADTAETDRASVYEAQVRAVQNRAFKVKHLASDLQAQLSSTRSFLEESTKTLPDDDRRFVETTLSSQAQEISTAIKRLDRLMGDSARREIMATVAQPTRSLSARKDERKDIMQDLKSLQRRIDTYRSDVAASDRNTFFGEVDRVWKRVESFDGEALTANAKLKEIQRKEVALLRDRLSEESGNVADSTRTLDATNEGAADLVGRVARHGMSELLAEFNDAVLRADIGIVDVYWLEKITLSEEMTALVEDRNLRLKELDQRYGIVKQKLDD